MSLLKYMLIVYKIFIKQSHHTLLGFTISFFLLFQAGCNLLGKSEISGEFGSSLADAKPASLSISDGPVSFDYLSVTKNATSSKTFTVTNSGGSTATFGTIDTSSLALAAPFILSGGTCSILGSLNAGSTCTLIVDFTPTTLATSIDTISLGYNDGTSAQITTRALSGTGVTPASLAFSGLSDFGSYTVGNTSSTQTITITNSGASAATNVYVALSSGTQFAISTTLGTNTCGISGNKATVAGSSTCVFNLNFIPASAGVKSDTLTVTYDDGATTGHTQTATAGGTGVAAAILGISDGPTYTYPSTGVNGTNAKTFTVTNSGGVAATLGTVSTAGIALAAPFSLSGGTCATGASIAAAGSCTLIVQFAPTSTVTSTDTISLSYNNGASTQSASIDLSGTGSNLATLAFSPATSYDYGSVQAATSNSHTFTLSNSGGGGASAVYVAISGAGYSLANNNCGTSGSTVSIAVNASCTFDVVLNTATEGTKTGTISLSYNDGNSTQTTPSVSLTASAYGAASQLAVTQAASTTATSNVALSQQPIITIQDASGNTVINASTTVSVSAFTDSGCTLTAGLTGALTGNSVAAINGVATFGAGVASSITYSSAQTIYLKYTAGAVTKCVATALAVSATPADATNSLVLGSATYAPNDGTAFVTIIVIPKTSGNANAGAGKTIEVNVTSGTATLTGASNCRVNVATCKTATDAGGGQYTITATSPTTGAANAVVFSATSVESGGDVVITATRTVTFDNGQFSGGNGFTLSGNTTIDGTYAGKNLYVTGGTITFDATTSGTNNFALGDVFIRAGTLKHTTSSTTILYRMRLAVNSLNLQGTASINADGLGYPSGYGYLQPSGLPNNNSTNAFVTNAHGGTGGHTGTPAYDTYDDIANPQFPGGGSNGAGGGVVRITATGSCSFANTASISAKGTDAGAGAAGGTVYLNCASLSAPSWTGTITANGGSSTLCCGGNGGGGGGGRISLISSGSNGAADWSGNLAYPDSSTISTFIARVKALGGSGAGTGGTGGAGTIYVKHASQTYGSLIVNSTGVTNTINSGVTFLPSLAGTISQLSGTTATVSVNAASTLSTKYTNIYSNTYIRPDVTATNGTASDYSDDFVKTITANNATTLTLSDTTGLAANGATAVDDTTFRTLHIYDTLDLYGGAIVQTNGDIYLTSGTISSPGASAGVGGFLSFNGSAALQYPSFSGNLTYTQSSGTVVLPTANISGYLLSLSGGSLTINGSYTTSSALSVSGSGALVTTDTLTAGGLTVSSTASVTAPTINVGANDVTVSSSSSSALVVNTLTAKNLTISAGTVKHQASTSAPLLNRLQATLSGNFSISNAASINADGLGYPSGYGYLQPSGLPNNNSTNAFVTNAHGGTGGHTGTPAYDTYDDIANPQFPGGGSNGAGGGVVRITATGSCSFANTASISAKGTDAGAGAAGGTVYLNCASLSAPSWTGTITANGGSSTLCCGGNGGGGGGGRISLISSGSNGAADWSGNLAYPDSSTISTFIARVKALGGSGAGTGGTGGAGTIYVKHASQTYGSLIVNSTGVTNTINSGVTFLPSLAGTISQLSGTTATVSVNAASTLSTKYTNIYSNTYIRPDVTATNGTASDYSDDFVKTITANNATTLTLSDTTGLAANGATAVDDTTFRTLHIYDTLDLYGGAIVQTNGDIYLTSGTISSPGASAGVGGFLSFNGSAALQYPSFSGNLTYTQSSGTVVLPTANISGYLLSLSGGSLTINGSYTTSSALSVSGSGALVTTDTLTAGGLTVSSTASVTAPTINVGANDVTVSSSSSSALVVNTLTAKNLTISAGTVKHQASTSAPLLNRLQATLSGNFSISNAASINADGLGYPSGYGYLQPSGLPNNNSTNAFVTNAHGGTGGHTGTPAYDTYDDIANPQFPGGGSNGAGGGVVRITATGSCSFANTASISAKGTDAGAGAAGGTVYLNCASLSAPSWTGTITANGGSSTLCCGGNGGGGGGGRISLISSGSNGAADWSGNLAYPDSSTISTFIARVKALGGSGAGTGGTGGAGTIYVKHASQTYGSLIVNSTGVTNTINSGVTFLPSLAGTITAKSAPTVTVTAFSTPGLAAKYTNIYAGTLIIPDTGYTAGTSLVPTDDNLCTLTANTATQFTTATCDLTGVVPTTNYRSILLLDALEIRGNGKMISNGDIWLMTGCDLHSTPAPSTTFQVPSGSTLSGSNLGSSVCSEAAVTPQKGATINFSTYTMTP